MSHCASDAFGRSPNLVAQPILGICSQRHSGDGTRGRFDIALNGKNLTEGGVNNEKNNQSFLCHMSNRPGFVARQL
jgi:hypothetical protein